MGLVQPSRLTNGYRDYSEHHVWVVREIRALAQGGISASAAAPFIECLDSGHQHGDECPASLAAYRTSTAELDRTIASLASRPDLLAEKLQKGASRTFRTDITAMTHASMFLPENLPIPEDDGATAHLVGQTMPALTLSGSDGHAVNLAELGNGRTIIYLYPLTGAPGTDLPEGWDSIPGAGGCTTEACDFRDHHQMLRDAGAVNVYGLSSQDLDYQREVVTRLRLPFPMLSDPEFSLAERLHLPTFRAPGHERLHARLTLVVNSNVIEHVFYPVFPPNTHAQQVLEWIIGRDHTHIIS